MRFVRAQELEVETSVPEWTLRRGGKFGWRGTLCGAASWVSRALDIFGYQIAMIRDGSGKARRT